MTPIVSNESQLSVRAVSSALIAMRSDITRALADTYGQGYLERTESAEHAAELAVEIICAAGLGPDDKDELGTEITDQVQSLLELAFMLGGHMFAENVLVDRRQPLSVVEPTLPDLAFAETHPDDMIFTVTMGDKIERTNLFGVVDTFRRCNNPDTYTYRDGLVPQVYWNLGGTLIELHCAVGKGERALANTEGRYEYLDANQRAHVFIVELRMPQGDMVRHRYEGATKIFGHFYL